jgi:hypothetical protein
MSATCFFGKLVEGKIFVAGWLPWILNNGGSKLFGWFGAAVVEVVLRCVADWCGHAW